MKKKKNSTLHSFMNYDTNSISMNIDIGKKKYTKKIKKKKRSIFFY